MKKADSRLIIPFIYTWIQSLMTGMLVFQTFVMYPNIFSNPPSSLELAMKFFRTIGPGDFFPPFGAATIITGFLCLALSFRTRAAFYFFLASMILFALGDGVLSVLYFWPRNTILFIQGSAKHDAATLQQVAREFHQAHILRFIASMGTSLLALLGLMHLVLHSKKLKT